MTLYALFIFHISYTQYTDDILAISDASHQPLIPAIALSEIQNCYPATSLFFARITILHSLSTTNNKQFFRVALTSNEPLKLNTSINFSDIKTSPRALYFA